jgi:hypothetical protein
MIGCEPLPATAQRSAQPWPPKWAYAVHGSLLLAARKVVTVTDENGD